jgi:hypothetical protein
MNKNNFIEIGNILNNYQKEMKEEISNTFNNFKSLPSEKDIEPINNQLSNICE